MLKQRKRRRAGPRRVLKLKALSLLVTMVYATYSNGKFRTGYLYCPIRTHVEKEGDLPAQ
ncbi:hypothetical protein FRX31_005135 [Thalictrum thalictroides]|uniref:Uncharacterized protein n=1 Tax=Thalictrum thalictroides TaxID=46969 RepID=A0A7J6X694_THATH|nr:hypothetical protein FRX31_005135 [Thalictrum thalictroides]